METETPMLVQAGTKRTKQYLCAISVSLGAVCAGTHLSWTSPALGQLSDWSISKREEGMIGGALPIGALLSAIPIGYFSARFGRKKTLILIACCYMISWLWIAPANRTWMLVVGRFIGGLATGAICVTAPIYVGEISEMAIRATLASFFQLFLCSGILLTNILGTFINWQLMSWLLLLVPLLFGLSLIYIPESPFYLLECDDVDQARKVLIRLRQTTNIEDELRLISAEIENHCTTGFALTKSNLLATISVVGTLAFQQLTGISAVVFYTEPIFETVGNNVSGSVAGIILGAVQVGASYLSTLIIERANRKFYLMLSSCGMFISLLSLAIYFHFEAIGVSIKSINYLPIASAIFYMICFAIGFGPIPWLLLAELLAPEIKSTASGLAIVANWTSAFLITFFFPILNGTFGQYVSFYVLTIVTMVATLFVFVVVPETRGKNFGEIQEMLRR